MNRRILICPHEEKMRLLDEQQKDACFHNVKYFTKQEFLDQYYYSYDENVFFYLMKKYGWHMDVIQTYLDSLYGIDEEREYSYPEIIFLRDLKKELYKEGFLKRKKSFRNYLKDSTIEISHIYDFDSYVLRDLNCNLSYPIKEINTPVYEFQTMMEEVNFVCIQIVKLIQDGVSPSKIFLGNVGEDYYYTLKKYFSYYHIPITIPFSNSIYSHKKVQDFLHNPELECPEELVPLWEKYSSYDLADPIVWKVFLEEVKNTYQTLPKITPSVECINIYHREFLEDEYIFVLGFQQDSLPVVYQDTDYIPDMIKKEIGYYPSYEKNQIMNDVTVSILSHIPNLFLSYKLKTPFQSFLPSSLIRDLGLKVISNNQNQFEYSHFYNKVHLAKLLDRYYTYGEKDVSLDLFLANYTIPYHTYSNRFQGISKDLYLENIPYPLRLSYTSFNSYMECKFKYYLQYVLKLSSYEDSFASFVGSLYHKILSLYQKTPFDFEKEYQKYLEKRDLSLKETLLLVRIKKDLLELLSILKKQQTLTGYDEELTEEKVSISLDKNVSVEFMGYIDKIMIYRNIEDVYFSIIDYKTGDIDTHIEPMKYGLHMQLPVYLYLVHYGRLFQNPIFTGIYYQNILFPYPSWSEKLEKEKKERTYLQGYSTDNIDILERFDSTYQDSEMIKSMKYSSDKGFSSYSKVLDDDTYYRMVEYTKDKINQGVDCILDADFQINPKVYAGDNISCKYCSYHDVCYQKEKDLVYYDKVEDLSFLGGEE